PRAFLGVERAHRRSEHHPLVDLGLELQLELRGGAPRTRPLDDIHEVADPFDDLTERVERCVFTALGQRRKPHADFEVAVSALTQEERLALARCRAPYEVPDVRDAIESVEAFERLLDANGKRPNARETAVWTAAWERGHWSTPRVPRVGNTPRDVRALARRSLPVFS